MRAARGATRPRPRGRRGKLLRATPALSVLLISLGLLVSHMARLGHMLITSHVICEHGALVDEHGDHHQAVAAARDEGDAGQHPEERAKPGQDAPSAEHEHCDPSSLKAASLAVSVACVVPTLLDGELLPWSVRPQSGEAPIALLLLAPKSSPPA